MRKATKIPLLDKFVIRIINNTRIQLILIFIHKAQQKITDIELNSMPIQYQGISAKDQS